VPARRRWRRSRPDGVLAANLVRPNFNPSGPDLLWAAGVTQFRTCERWLYLPCWICGRGE
jgi:transposase InsO family protein